MRNLYLRRFAPGLCSVLLLIAVPSRVMAGSVPVFETDSSTTGQADGFAAGAIADRLPEEQINAQISAAFVSSLQTILNQRQVQVGDQRLQLSVEDIQAFNTILSGGADAEIAANFLVQQMSADIGVDLDLELIAASGDNLNIVVSNVNTLVRNLNRAQLIRAVRSAPLQAILQSLRAAVDAAEDDEVLAGGNTAVLIRLKLL